MFYAALTLSHFHYSEAVYEHVIQLQIQTEYKEFVFTICLCVESKRVSK